jgi:competence CoiA-like predicted nuclease
MPKNVADRLKHEDKDHFYKTKPRFIIKDLEGNTKFIIEEINKEIEDPAEEILSKLKKSIEAAKKTNDDVDHHFMDEFPPEVRYFVKKQNAQQDQFNNLHLTLERIKEFLNNQNVEYKITPGLFTDPEYPEWQEIELKIRIKKDLDFIYENFKPKIYELVRYTVPEKLLDKILVDLESF